MQNNQSSYSRWTWIVALILALILLWMLLTGRGPSSACCGAPVAAPVEEVIAAAPVVAAAATPTEAFGFSASCNDFTNTGDATNYAWVAKSADLKTILCNGEGLKAEGDDKHVVLTGLVDTDATRTKIGDDTQAFYGPDFTVDNQITVKVAAPVAVMEAPPAAKLYFDTGKTNQPNDSNDKLASIVAWLQAHPESKAVVSGFHDPRGSQARNAQLAKGRAQSTYDALVAAGIDATRIEMREPASENGGSDLQEARRVEVSVE
jgi:outer membrane protein OmpA-like peptidoglycan-associated protein